MDLPSPSSSFGYAFTYDVFLSFRGSDTRHGFTGNLYKALCDKGIHTFIDDEELRGGDEITPSLVNAIQESTIAIPVFSANYASSSFCLDELVTITDCIKAKGRLVLPVFYNVDPSHVRHQTGTYAKALAKHEARFKKNKEKLKGNMERLKKWKMALNQTANLSGRHYKHGHEYEHEFIGKIVEEVSRAINRAPLPIANYPVGLQAPMEKVNSLLVVGSDDGVHIVGIHGIGGVGKTTLALAVYNSIADSFDGSCFLENVRETSKKHGLQHLQSILLNRTVGGEKKIVLTSVQEGKSMISQRLGRKKVLLILDDVDEQDQLQAIVGRPEWFGPGSRVIITTRDQQLLASHDVNTTYELNPLSEEDALRLLSYKAFKSENVDTSYADVLNRVVNYASGLPLALEVIGSNLCGKSIEAWDSAINQYERIPSNKILETLKISFDALEEEEKNVFLDIACCFKGYDLVEVKDILHAHHGYCVEHHIQVLNDRSLIKVSEYYSDKVTLHDLIEDMGKEIVRRESSKEPGKRSRLWFHKDVVQVFEQDEGSNKIEIIFLEFQFSEEEEVKWDGDGLKKMKSLKTLIIKNGRFSQGPSHLPNSLRVLEWRKYPLEYLPSHFCPNKLAICKFDRSCISSLGLSGLLLKKVDHLCNILHFDLNKIRFIKSIPNVSGLQILEKLSFQHCSNLCRIHDSVGLLNNLKFLNAWGCKRLRCFPPLNLTSLETLDLSHCLSLESFPEISVKMENMTELLLLESPIKRFPRSFINLTGLQTLIVTSCSTSDVVAPLLRRDIVTMPKLSLISITGIEGCIVHNKEDEGEEKVSSSNVETICMQRCNLTDDFFLLVNAWFPKLYLHNCKHLQEIEGIPPNLKIFNAIGCTSMTPSCRSKLLNQELYVARKTIFPDDCYPSTINNFSLPGSEIPNWFEPQSMGTSISFRFRNRIPRLVFCLVVLGPAVRNENLKFVQIINGIREPVYIPGIDYIKQDHIYLLHFGKMTYEHELLNQWNHAEISVVDDSGMSRKILGGMHVCKEEYDMEDIQFIDPRGKRKLDDDLDTSESQHHQLRKKHRFVDSQVSETQIVQQQQGTGFLSHVKNWARSVFSFLPTPAMQSLDDHVNENSWSLASNADNGQH
ncbi:TMV resistance protein N-like [Abrus precatorius]|uniref:TMV resistance protein N-like n=1 Tax=Abrus precatorius TaxID=3816 RepID=A0A8B8LPJ0_ABRPR|nr:TMV resistance protein N-like [Abrus precatorius]